VESVDGDVGELVAEDFVQKITMIRPEEYGMQANEVPVRVGPPEGRTQTGAELNAHGLLELGYSPQCGTSPDGPQELVFHRKVPQGVNLEHWSNHEILKSHNNNICKIQDTLARSQRLRAGH
jgi:hypothetical protein